MKFVFLSHKFDEVIVKTRLKEHLKNQGRSNKWLAQKLGKSENIVSLYTNCKVNIPVAEIYKICKILQIEIDDILYSIDEISKFD